MQFQRPPRRLRERFVGADQEAGRHPQSPHSGSSFFGSSNITISSKLTAEVAWLVSNDGDSRGFNESFAFVFQTPDEAKLDYNRIQRGGDIPHYGLRMSAPDRAKGRKQTICTFIKGCGGMKHGSRDQERFCVLSSWKLVPAEFPGRNPISHCTMIISTLLSDVHLN